MDDVAGDDHEGPAEADAAALAVLFTRALRQAGLEAALGSVIMFLEAIEAVGPTDRRAVYWAGRSTLVHRPEDIELYDQVFDAFWVGSRPMPARVVVTEQVTIAYDDPDDAQGGEAPEAEPSSQPTLRVRYSDVEVLKDKDFALCTVAELDEARRLMSKIRLTGARRPSRRPRRSKTPTSRLDLRRTVRHALRSDGEALRRAYRTHGERNRRLVLLLDISGSMEAYSRALLRFVHAAVVGRTKVEAFTLGTRLSRLTRELQTRDPDEALARAARSVEDWSGGTRLGESLRRFNDEWGVRGMARGAIVVILSDGWDRGEPALLAEQMERLERVAFRVIWVNPLKASPGYAPLAQGMAAALPHVDAFIEGHSLASLEELADVIAS
ncbi:MAG: VWA domain-containing protein [Acidimicrobiia bacterium]|nr:VWA domain-containing protein [Acidimicrobiia bacterium]